MPTLLVTSKMKPALASRVQAAVTGRTARGTATHASARLMRTVRFIVALGLAGLLAAVLLSLRHEQDELRKAREDLVAQWAAEATSVSSTDLDFLRRVETKLVEFGNQYSGDFIDHSLTPEGAFTAQLARPTVYIRGSLASFSSSNAVAKAARESGKDTLLLCLVEPPAARDEKALMERARVALFSASQMYASTTNVLRLYDAEAGMQYLLPSFGDQIRDAKDDLQLRRLSREFKAAPVALAKRALRSEILIAAFDEPNDKSTITELDGEAPHYVRLVVMRLDSMVPLLKLRRHVDPGWITANRRPQYARELDGCRLSLDVHDAVNTASK
jgi:hypothetical protein